MEVPDYLYHYTSVESLALILKNKTIRLNSMDQMDELQEKETADIKNFGQFYYVSSWTDDDVESIPMWSIYTKIDAGVRIKLHANPFLRRNTTVQGLRELGHQVTHDSGLDSIDTFIPMEEMMKGGYYSVQGYSGDILRKVIYTDDKSLLYPTINKSAGGKLLLDTRDIGIYKNTRWAFQKEWRYLMTFLPFRIGDIGTMRETFDEMGDKILSGEEKQPFPYYDLPINDEAYRHMEVMLSPKISAGNRELIMSVIYRYNPQIIVSDSSLLGLIR